MTEFSGRSYDRTLLYAFGFEQLGVVVSDLFFYDPAPDPGQEGAERGVRLELRILDRDDLPGSIYSSQPIRIGRPVIRVDLLETTDGQPGSFDRTHHHPRFEGWEPGTRVFIESLSADPLQWINDELGDLNALLLRAGFSPDDVGPSDSDQLREAIPEIAAAVDRLLKLVRSRPIPDDVKSLVGARDSWL